MASKPSIVLGISFGHGDSSAALIVDGCLIAAAEEERFTRVKHYALFPTEAIAYCLRHAQITPKEVQVVAIGRRPGNALGRKLKFAWQHPELMFRRRKSGSRESLGKKMKQSGLAHARIVKVEHHLAHLMSSRYLCSSEDLALFSFDGLGDFVSASIGRPSGPGVEILDRVYFPNSLGYFYTAMTQFLGFPYFGDEFKVMGLSSFGEPRYVEPLRQLIRETPGFGFELNLEAFPVPRILDSFSIENAQPQVQPYYNANLLTQLIGVPARKPKDPLTRAHSDLAKSVQVRFEEVATHCLLELHKKVPARSLALSGGCAHNSVWVGKIPQLTPFKEIWVAPASHDAGIAVGAAVTASQTTLSCEGKHWALVGPSELEIPFEVPVDLPFEVKEHEFPNEKSLVQWIVDELCRKRIIGLCHGRMEFGPRALGARSIIADPRWPDMRDRLNERVKHRENFRPFAASVLWEHQEEWFNHSFFSPAMEAVFDVKAKGRDRIPALVHADNSCRIQSVKHDTQPFYWEIIEAFRKKTGIPMIVNTSFNDCEPIVCNVKDAWSCFTSTDLDHLVIGTRAFSKVRQSMSLAG